jgi:hypothetical protein
MALGNPTHRAVGYAAAASAAAASTTVPSGDVIHVCVAARKQTSAFGAADFTVSDTGGHTWTKFFDRQAYDAGSNPRVALQWFWAISNGSATVITAGHTESVATFVAVESYTIGAGMVPSCTNFGSNGNAAGDPSVTLGATPDSLTMSSSMAAAANGVTPPTGYTELVEQTNNGTHEVCYDNTSTWSATVSYTTGNVNMLAVVGEIDEVSAGGTTYTLTASGGSFATTGVAAGLKATRQLAASAGSASIGGVAATLKAARQLSGAAGAYTLTGVDATLTKAGGATGYTLTAAAGSFAITGQAAGLKAARVVGASFGAYAVTGVAATLARGLRLTASAGAVTITGAAANLTQPSRAIGAASGSFAITGFDAALTFSGAPAPVRRGDDAPGMRWAHSTAGAARRSLYARQIAEVAERLRDLPPKPKKKAKVLEAVAEALADVVAIDPYLAAAVEPVAEAVDKALATRTVASFDPAEVALLLDALARAEAEAHRRWRRRRDEAALLAILFAA